MRNIETIIKILFAEEGYLPAVPYHLVSSEEMYHAFMNEDGDPSWFYDKYPLIDSSLTEKYAELVTAIKYHIDKDRESNFTVGLPDWVYSYMLGSVIFSESSEADRHYLLTLINLDNMSDVFDAKICESIYDISRKWILKLPAAQQDHRPPTIFGEPHVIKSLRLSQVDLI